MSYVDGFVLPIPTENKETYRQFSLGTIDLFKRNGARRIIECWGDEIPEGEQTSFPMAVKLEENETVMFSLIVWDSREARDKGWEAIMADPDCPPPGAEPFDGKRLIMGGFEVLIDE